MTPDATTEVHETVQFLWDDGALGRLSDSQLLHRFIAGPELASEASFTVLVDRHGSMVRRVCLDLLGDAHEAQDAAQAVFLVLARKARSIRKPDSLGPWLHGVSVRVSHRARTEAARRRIAEKRKAEIMAERIEATPAAESGFTVDLHEQLERLPEKYRNPIVLCYLLGHTQEQAAQQLGWPLGTVQTRLHRGRAQLRARLSRGGVGPSGLASALTLSDQITSAALGQIPSSWTKATAIAAVRFAARKTTDELVAPSVAKLAESVLGVMLRESLRFMALTVLAVGLAGATLAFGYRGVKGGRALRAASQDAAAVAAAPADPVRIPLASRDRPGLDQAIERGVRYLNERQNADGSWTDIDNDARTGTTSLVTLALLDSGEPRDSPAVMRAVEFLRRFTAEELKSTYAISLQTRVFAAVGHQQDRLRIAQNAKFLERSQIVEEDHVNWPGSWTYSQFKNRHGDGSNSFFALIALHAAAEAGIPVNPRVWPLVARYWTESQQRDGGWGYTGTNMVSTGSMTTEGAASLIVARLHGVAGQEALIGDEIRGCGRWKHRPAYRRGIEWLSTRYQVGVNPNQGQQWRYYLIEAVERLGELNGERFLGAHDWFRDEADNLIRVEVGERGLWRGAVFEQDPLVATSFALMFLGRGRAPILIHKLKHGPGGDWMNDPDDVRNLTESVARDWKRRLNWQVADIESATIEDLLTAPIAFLNGHDAPELSNRARKTLRTYIDRGGFLFAEACCGKKEFDQGFRALIKELFPEPELGLQKLAADHPIWTAGHALKSSEVTLWGLELSGRTVLIYSPNDLSCGWNTLDRQPGEVATREAINIGQNIVNYATGQKAHVP